MKSQQTDCSPASTKPPTSPKCPSNRNLSPSRDATDPKCPSTQMFLPTNCRSLHLLSHAYARFQTGVQWRDHFDLFLEDNLPFKNCFVFEKGHLKTTPHVFNTLISSPIFCVLFVAANLHHFDTEAKIRHFVDGCRHDPETFAESLKYRADRKMSKEPKRWKGPQRDTRVAGATIFHSNKFAESKKKIGLEELAKLFDPPIGLKRIYTPPPSTMQPDRKSNRATSSPLPKSKVITQKIVSASLPKIRERICYSKVKFDFQSVARVESARRPVLTSLQCPKKPLFII